MSILALRILWDAPMYPTGDFMSAVDDCVLSHHDVTSTTSSVSLSERIGENGEHQEQNNGDNYEPYKSHAIYLGNNNGCNKGTHFISEGNVKCCIGIQMKQLLLN
eukprot:136642_1